MPMTMKATSFTIDSTAIAATSPSCRSEEIRFLAPKMTAKTLKNSAARKLVWMEMGDAPGMNGNCMYG